MSPRVNGTARYFSDHSYGATVGVVLPICMVVSARPEGSLILTLVGLKVQDAAQNTSPVLPERRIIFGTSCSLIEEALERKANLSPKLKRRARFERVVRPCFFSSHGCALRAWCERRRKRAEGNTYAPGAWPVRRQPASRCVRAPRPHFTGSAFRWGLPNGRPAILIA